MDTPRGADFTAAVVALKAQDHAKSRLGSLPNAFRRALAAAMAADTLSALVSAVDHVLVVGQLPDQTFGADRELTIEEIVDPDTPGLNAALSHGAALLRARGVPVVLACVGDLPALRPESVRLVREAAGPYARSFLADAGGIGTTMLIARGTDLQPGFGIMSARKHTVSGAQPLAPHLDDVLDARTDVDTEVDLAAATRLGVGPATTAVLQRFGRLRPRRSA